MLPSFLFGGVSYCFIVSLNCQFNGSFVLHHNRTDTIQQYNASLYMGSMQHWLRLVASRVLIGTQQLTRCQNQQLECVLCLLETD